MDLIIRIGHAKASSFGKYSRDLGHTCRDISDFKDHASEHRKNYCLLPRCYHSENGQSRETEERVASRLFLFKNYAWERSWMRLNLLA